MTTLDQLLATQAITRLITLYAALNDAARWDEVAALYTEDGRMSRPTAPDSFTEGRAAILAGFLARPARASRHIVANILIDVAADGATATATSQILLFLASDAEDGGLPIQSPKPPLVGSYADRLAYVDGAWKFTERRGSLDFRQA